MPDEANVSAHRAAIQISALTRRFGDLTAVDQVTLSIHQSEIFGLIGPNGGMIRRLEIAQSLLHRPAVLFLDEPTVGLDPAARETVWEHVTDLRDRFNRTMVVTSHHMDEIEEFCDRIALIDRGRLAALGTPAELKAAAGPGATLDDVFIRLVAARNESEAEGSYDQVRRARRAAREHG